MDKVLCLSRLVPIEQLLSLQLLKHVKRKVLAQVILARVE